MAVNVSTFTSVCLYCKADSNSVIEQEFHEIYDEVGLELQLPSLVETFFHIKVKNEGRRYLCDDCVNRLIELYDVQEHSKEKSIQSEHQNCMAIELAEGNAKNTERTVQLEKEQCERQIDKIFQIEGLTTRNPEGPLNSNSEITLLNDLSGSGVTPHTFVPRSDDENLQHDIKIEENLDYEEESVKSTSFALQDVVDESDIDENLTNEFDFSVTNIIDESQELTNLTNTTIEVSNSSNAEIQEDFIEELINVNINTNNSEDNEFQSQISDAEGQLSETEIATPNNHDADNSMNNDLYEQLDETFVSHEQNDETEEMVMEGIFQFDEDHNRATVKPGRKRAFKEIAFSQLDVENHSSNKSVTITLNSEEIDGNLNTENYEGSEILDKNQDELSNDSLALEEEYLIEEISCSEEYDEIDLNEYLDKVLLTKFQDLQLSWETECKICLSIYPTFEELLNHSCVTEIQEEQQFHCTIENCSQNVDSLPELARHLVLTHYDKLESVPIYGKCPDCQKTFSNILDFNKHSCCRNIKRKTGTPNYCQHCDEDFQSLKRYVFHMQFHLTNRRPKVCLLCGVLFKTSNEFFEHTQYQHVPEAAMACIKCDRFFKDKDVFAQHVSSHDTKYLHSCSLCPKKYTNKFILAQHMDIYHSNSPSTMKCKHCEKEFVSRVSYRNHVKCHDTDVEVEAFICSTCGIVTGSMEHIKYHVESDEDSPCFSSLIEEKVLSLVYTCENCSLDYHTIKDLKHHRLSSNHSDDFFVCGICRQSFKTLRHMRNHYTNHKDLEEWKASFPITRYFVCNIGDCQEFYSIWTTLYYHKKRPHKMNKPILADDFKCQFCQINCSSKMSLAVHVARSHNNSNIKCSYCKRSFKSQKHLQEHIDKYHTPVECNVCFKKFKHRRNLESHNNMVHLSIKRYFCKHCNKGYFHKSEKDIHEKKVHPKVSYNCELCNFVTTYPESLQVHMDKHNNQLKFSCTICGKAFGRKQLLQCHLKRHLNKKDFVCCDYLKLEGCDSTFLTYNLLKRHIQTKHPNSAYSNNLKNNHKTKLVENHTDMDEVEENSFEIWVDDGSTSEISTNVLRHHDTEDLQQDPIELIFEEDDEQLNDQ